MRCKLIAIYERPADEEAFLKHYRAVHVPLVEKVTSLERLVVSGRLRRCRSS